MNVTEMNERFEPPLVVVVVGRPGSTDWCKTNESGTVEWTFFDELFRCFSYDIGSSRAANPAIPVYFSIGEFAPDDASSPPPLIDIARTRRTLVFVLLDSGFRKATDRWTRFFADMRRRAQDSSNELLFIPMARVDDGQLRRDILRLGLGTVAPVCAYLGDERCQQLNDAARFFRVSAMIAAIQALRSKPDGKQPIDVFISYARRDGESVAHRLRDAVAGYPGIGAIIDSMAFSPGASVDADLLEEKLAASTCVVVFQTNSYADRVWCRREALLAKKCDAPIIVVELLGGLERRGWLGLANCPRFRMSGEIDCDFKEIVEIAVSETLRIAHHRSRSAAMLALAGIDPHRVEVLPRTPDLLRLVGLVASNAQAVRLDRRPKDLILHPDPPLPEDELSVLRMVDPNFQFLTPSTIIIDTVTTEMV
jgi:hypothetical protein